MAKFYVLRGRRALWNLLIIAAIVLALVYVFWSDDEHRADQGEAPEGEDLAVVVVEPVTVRSIPTKFAEYKLERERIRSRQLELWQNLAYDAQSEVGRRGEAQNELRLLIERMGKETEIESLLKAKGYLDVLVMLDEETIAVVLPVTLTRDEAARIGDLVHRITGTRLERITIVDETISA